MWVKIYQIYYNNYSKHLILNVLKCIIGIGAFIKWSTSKIAKVIENVF